MMLLYSESPQLLSCQELCSKCLEITISIHSHKRQSIMCLITEQKIPLIATEDMVVYKLMKDEDDSTTVTSPFQNTTYNLEQLYKVEMAEDEDKCWNADHIISELLEEHHPYWSDGLEELNYIGAGFHTMTTIERRENAGYNRNYIMYQCTIPAGSEYYLDATGLCVSNQLIVVKKVDNDK